MVSQSGGRGQSEAFSKILAMLNMMHRSEEENLVFNHVALLLEEYEQKHNETEQLLSSLVSLILGAFSVHLDPESTLYTQIKLLQYRLTSPVTYAELVSLQHYVESCADQITQSEYAEKDSIKETLFPLLRSFGLENENVFSSAKITDAHMMNAEYDTAEVEDEITSKNTCKAINQFGKSLHELLSTNYLSNSIEQSEKFGVLLEVELATLKRLNDISSFEERKDGVLLELEKILESHRQLTSFFQTMTDFVSSLQQDSVRLTQELDRVTLLSLTDELTGLPNRRAFTRRLQDEIARVKRYGHELSIALLDIDHFKPVNDQYGHAAGDKVLKCYAEMVLSTFRQHDMVARYGGEEFVVIFPNTDIHGAFQALKKVQHRAENSKIEINDLLMPLPTFSAGLVEYNGELEIEKLIQRADAVLYDAKAKGRNRIELEYSTCIPE